MRAAAAFARLGGGRTGAGAKVGTADITGLDIHEVEMVAEGPDV